MSKFDPIAQQRVEIVSTYGGITEHVRAKGKFNRITFVSTVNRRNAELARWSHMGLINRTTVAVLYTNRKSREASVRSAWEQFGGREDNLLVLVGKPDTLSLNSVATHFVMSKNRRSIDWMYLDLEGFIKLREVSMLRNVGNNIRVDRIGVVANTNYSGGYHRVAEAVNRHHGFHLVNDLVARVASIGANWAINLPQKNYRRRNMKRWLTTAMTVTSLVRNNNIALRKAHSFRRGSGRRTNFIYLELDLASADNRMAFQRIYDEYDNWCQASVDSLMLTAHIPSATARKAWVTRRRLEKNGTNELRRQLQASDK